MKYLFVCALIWLFACNQPHQQHNTIKSSVKEEVYPKDIRDKNLDSLYDKSKWLIYCIHCDEYCKFYKKLNILDTPQFGTLDLRFNKVENFSDTTELSFYFYYKDSIKCNVNTVYNYGELTYGVAFKGNNKDSAIYYLSETTINRFYKGGLSSRYENPLQPEVIAFMKSNKDKLNPWFREEAKRRKIIE
jgi:hypothetical protein